MEPNDLDGQHALLRERFRIAAFYDWQGDAVRALLSEQARVLLVAPTGGGKSLCYQFPAVALGGTTLVLSPLISLMQDQVRALEARGIEATFVASSLPREENARRLAGMRRGAYRMVYAAPERLAFDGFLDALASSALGLVAIDEAHCIVQWGHAFRPDYLRIGALLERLRPARVIACTATATPDARAEILRQLGWDAATTTEILRGFARPNLHLSIGEVDGPREARTRTAAALREALGTPRSPRGAGIVYAATRKRSEELARELVEDGFRARAYHAGLPSEERAEVNDAFASRELPVVVATNAFGMGIDRPDVRVVVHAQPPASIEAYYQEVGRAGRDGAPASGLLLIAGADIALRRRLADLGQDGAAARPEDVARQWGLFRELLRYIGASTCRHDFILRYFGDEAESLGGCGQCDVCLGIDEAAVQSADTYAADLDTVRRALAGVARTKGRAGMQAVASMLAGETNERVRRCGLDRLSTFGVLAQRSQHEAMAILRVLLANDWIDLTTNEYPVPMITPRGWLVMKGEHEVRVRLPALLRRRRRSAKGKAATDASGPASADVEGGGLFEALRTHRAQLAKQLGVPAYVVAPNSTLSAIAALRPHSVTELGSVKGMGPSRLETYGAGLLAVVAAFEANPG